MHSVLLRLGDFQLHSYGLCLAVGILCAYWVLVRLGRSRGFSSDRLANLLALLVVCGLAGARTFFVVEHWADYRADPASALRIWEGGLMFYGSIVFGAAALVLHCRATRTPVLPLLDLFAVAVPVGQAFGRVGCLLNGCCYGRPSGSRLAVTFPRWSIPCVEQIRAGLLPEDAPAAHPVRRPSSLAVAQQQTDALQAPVAPPHLEHGQNIPLLQAKSLCDGGEIVAARLRVALERADERAHPFGGPLTISQTISVGCLLLAAALVALALLRARAAAIATDGPSR